MVNSRLALISFAAVLTSASAIAAGPDPGVNVTVTNPTSRPVPVAIQGTGSITGSVTVTNTPNVNVVNEIDVRNSDNPALQPVVARGSATFGSVTGSDVISTGLSFYTVPAGKRLVIEYVTARVIVANRTNTGRAYANLRAGSESYAIGTSSDGAPCTLSQACFVISKPVKIYVNAGDFIQADWGVVVAVNGFAEATMVISGHLIDL